jgi:hypothetical protein
VRLIVQSIIALGKLPAESTGDSPEIGELVRKFETQIRQLQAPASLDEANGLLSVLGGDECYGLAWAIVHFIESAPDWVRGANLETVSPFWQEILDGRIQRSYGAQQ